MQPYSALLTLLRDGVSVFVKECGNQVCVCLCVVFQGGMRAVIYTDVFQSMVMIAGMLAIVVQVTFPQDGHSLLYR